MIKSPLKSSISIRTIDRKFYLKIKIMRECPCHFTKMFCSYFSQRKLFRSIKSKIWMNRNQISWDSLKIYNMRFVNKKLISRLYKKIKIFTSIRKRGKRKGLQRFSFFTKNIRNNISHAYHQKTNQRKGKEKLYHKIKRNKRPLIYKNKTIFQFLFNLLKNKIIDTIPVFIHL